MHVETYPAFLTPRDKKPSLSSSEKKILRECLASKKMKMKKKEKQSKALYILYIDRYYIYDYMISESPLFSVYKRVYIGR